MNKQVGIFKSLRIKMSKVQARAMRRIEAEDEEMIVYLAKKLHKERGIKKPKSYYENGCFALKQYYATAIFDPLHVHAISEELDTFWHAHVLDTVSYNMLCKDIGCYMHHDPLDPKLKRKYSDVLEVYKYTRQVVLPTIFGKENLDEIFHPVETLAVCLHDVDLLDDSSLINDSVFKENKTITKFKSQYGHKNRGVRINSSLLKRRIV